MVGTIIIIVILVLIVPVAIIMTGGIASAALGFFIKKDVDKSFEDHELLELSEKN